MWIRQQAVTASSIFIKNRYVYASPGTFFEHVDFFLPNFLPYCHLFYLCTDCQLFTDGGRKVVDGSKRWILWVFRTKQNKAGLFANKVGLFQNKGGLFQNKCRLLLETVGDVGYQRLLRRNTLFTACENIVFCRRKQCFRSRITL